MASTSVEITEAEHPIEILSYEFVPDKAGAGKYRGGTPYRRDYRLLEEEAVLQVRSDRRDFRPYGLYGGYPGKPSLNFINPTGENDAPVTAKLTMTMKRGDILRHELAGAAGWGDPLERDPTAVLRDVRNEMISSTTAENEYGVVIDMEGWTVDAQKTKLLRAEISQLRGWAEVPDVLREDPPALAAKWRQAIS